MQQPSWTPEGWPGRVPTEDEVAAFLAEAAELSSLDPRRRPLPAVLDTDFIRTGLHAQLSKGMPPRSVQSAQDGSLRLFMEYDTLVETDGRLPRISEQLGVPVAELRRILNEERLPHIDVVQLPLGLRELDPRALRVRDGDGVRLGDEADFPAAAPVVISQKIMRFPGKPQWRVEIENPNPGNGDAAMHFQMAGTGSTKYYYNWGTGSGLQRTELCSRPG